VSELSLWMNGERVGVWMRTRAGVHRLIYAPEWLVSERGRPLSLSLPFTPDRVVQGPQVLNYFDNLLPDSDDIRQRVQRRFALPDTEPMTLLGAIGRDCVGALQLLGPDEVPPPAGILDYDELDEAGVARALEDATALQGPDDHDDFDDFRISIAGAQEKTALLRVGDTWCRPRGATPTTHILKLPLGIVGGNHPDGAVDLRLSVENEWVCLKLLEAFGLPVARADIGTFLDRKALVVERFDRRWVADGRWIARLPQEDFCQATGTSWRNKYEGRREPGRGGVVGPGIGRCLEILGGAVNAAADKSAFGLCQFAFWLLAATDGHAKNFSLFIGRRGAISLTPFYDVISMWPSIGAGDNLLTNRRRVKLAMAVRSKNAHWLLRDIKPAHWQFMAQQSGMPGLFMRMHDLAASIAPCLNRVEAQLPANFPQPLWDLIRRGVEFRAERFLSQYEAGLVGRTGA
jgi:serine/threonine-protein kinase HipA